MRPFLRLTTTRGTAVLLLGLGALLATAAQAADAPPVVVELFTSQGCPGCRPAELLAAELSKRPGLLLLTWPVGYWDYLGWRDTLAQPASAERQRGYAAARGERQILTPESVVDGKLSVVGSDRAKLERALREMSGAASVPVSCNEQGERIVVDVGAAADPSVRAEVLLVPVLRSRTVAIEGGERPGRALYVHAARGVQRIGTWTGRAARFEAPRSAARVREADSYAILLQSVSGGRAGRIYGAARGPGL